MSRVHAKVNPDGSIEVDGTVYRLVEMGGRRYELERSGDHARVGAFELSPAGSEPLFVEARGGVSQGIVRAVADLLAEPRGLLPLQ